MNLRAFTKWMYGEGFAEGTIANTLRYLRRLKGFDLDKLTEETAYEAAGWLYKQKLSENSANNFAKAMNRYFDFKRLNYRLKLRSKRGDPDIWVPSEEEVTRLLAVEWDSPFITFRNRLLMALMIVAALRRNEARTLQFSDVRTTPVKKMRGAAYCYLYVEKGKGNKSRFVDIPKSLYDQVIHFKIHYARRSDFIFDNGKGVPISVNQVGKIVKEAGKRAGVPKIHPHAFRHYRTLDLDAKGVGPKTIMEFLGHANLSSTQTYLRGKKRAKIRDEIIEKDDLFGGLRAKLKAREARL